MSDFIPHFIGGLLVIAIGIVLSKIIRGLVSTIIRFFRVQSIVRSFNLLPEERVKVWSDVLSEIVGWAVIILFLIPASEIWGLRQVTEVLKEILYYIPSVIVAVVIAFVGLICANLAAEVVKQSLNGVNKRTAEMLSLMARYALIFFTFLIVLDQLGVARDLVRILFTGIVIMVSLAGGLAFGLGGKEIAQEMLQKMRKSR